MENIYNLVLDLKQKITQTEIVIPQHDENTQKFRMKITQNGENFKFEEGVTAELAVLKSDGNFVVIDADNQGDVFVATLTPQALTTTGLTKAELRFKKGSELLTSTQFTFVIREVVVSVQRVASTTVYKELETLVTKSDEITKKLDKAVKTFDNVEEIKKQLEEINTKILQAKEALEKNIGTANLKSEDIKKVIAQADTALQSFDSRKSEIENLKVLVKNATELNISLQNLLTQIQKAEEINQTLKTQTETATSIKNDLTAATQTGENLKQVLSDEVTKATQIEPTLKATNQQAESLKTTLVENNQKAKNLNKSIENNATKAEGLNTNLQQLISDGNLTKESLVPIVEDGKVKISTLEDLLSRVGKTKSEVEEIIAQGNLDKYITTVSLDNKLQAYATKEDLSKIDVTAQLVDYAKKTEVPTKLSQLANDKSFKTETEIIQLINNAKKLKKEVVTSLPSTGQEDIIYLLKNKGDANNFYTEYLWINGSWEIIGDTKVDLTDYAKKSDVKTKLSEMTSDSTHRTVSDTEKTTWDNKVDQVSGKTLSSNDFTNDFKSTIESLTMKDTPSSDFNSVSKFGIYNGSFSSNCPVGSGKYTLFIFPTDSSTQHQQNYMFQIAVKDNVEGTPYFRLRRGSTTWGKWYKYSSNDYTDTDKAKVTAIPANPKYTDTTYNDANQSYSGLMSSSDKRKLDGLKPVNKQDIKALGFPEHVVLTESAYNALSSTQKSATDIFYYIKA